MENKFGNFYKLITIVLILFLVVLFLYHNYNKNITGETIEKQPEILGSINKSAIIENWNASVNEEIQKVENGNSDLNNLAINIKSNFMRKLNLNKSDYAELYDYSPVMNELIQNTTLIIEEMINSQTQKNKWIPSIKPDLELPDTNFPELPPVPEMPDLNMPEVPNFDNPRNALPSLPPLPSFG